MTSDSDLMAWLRAEIEADGKSAAAKLRLSRHSGAYRRELTEKLHRAKAELAILDLYEKQASRTGESALQEDRARTLEPVARLLATGYRRRGGCPESEDDLRNFYYERTEPESLPPAGR